MVRTGGVHPTETQRHLPLPLDGLDLTFNDQDVADLESAPLDMETGLRND